MSGIKEIYNHMWSSSVEQYKANNCELDPLIHSPLDTRAGTTVLSYFYGGAMTYNGDETDVNSDVRGTISNFIEKLRTIEPEQYFYPVDELHLTVLSIISCVPEFTLADIELPEHVAAFKAALKGMKSFKIHYKGITISPSCVVLQGFPDDDSLATLRNNLRECFTQANLATSIDARYKITTAHTTIMRFQTPLRASCKFVELLEQHREYDFGTLDVKQLDFVFNNWYQQLSFTKNLKSVKLP